MYSMCSAPGKNRRLLRLLLHTSVTVVEVLSVGTIMSRLCTAGINHYSVTSVEIRYLFTVCTRTSELLEENLELHEHC